MKKLIAVLEDNEDRRAAMSDWLRERFGMYDHHFTDDPYEMIATIKTRRSDLLVVSLDHDLHERPDFSTELTGMIVAEHLAKDSARRTSEVRSLVTMGIVPVSAPPTPNSTPFPVILHTTNTRDGDTMERMLRRHGRHVERVIPFDGVTWVYKDWHRALKRAMQSNMATISADDEPD